MTGSVQKAREGKVPIRGALEMIMIYRSIELRCSVLILLAGLLLGIVNAATGQRPSAVTPIYQTPPPAIADLISAPRTPAVSLSPTDQWMLMLQRPSLPPIAEVAQPELRLAGMRINPRTNARSRVSYYANLTLKKVDSGAEHGLAGLPTDARIRHVRWSPDGSKIAFTVQKHDGLQLWAADVRTREARRIAECSVNAVYGTPYYWLADNRTLIAKITPPDRGPAPSETQVPAGPVIEQNIGRTTPARTYQDLLQNKHDEALFEHYLTAQIVQLTVDGEMHSIGQPGVVTSFDPSPDGQYLLVETIQRPYSYTVPVQRFPKRIEVWDLSGKVAYVVADVPLADQIPIAFGSVRTGRRSVGWRDDAAATMCWVEALDGGDAGAEADARDQVFLLDAPFQQPPTPFVTLQLRFGGITWGSDNLALVSEWWWSTRRTRTWIAAPQRPSAESRLLFDRSWEDRYSDPGSPLLHETPSGRAVLLTTDEGNTLYMSGSGATPEGNQPFLDRLNLTTKKTERLWRSEAPYYEFIIDLLDVESLRVLTRRETQTEPPNLFLRNLTDDTLTQLTDFPHPSPQLKDVHKQMIQYQRDDGVKLNGTLYLPPGKKPEDGPFPLLMWAYPTEFKSADAAGQVTDSPYRFVRTSTHSPLLWLVHGYAVLDDPTLPIVGAGDQKPNDTYIQQLVAGAKAAVDEVVRRGVADPKRIAIGGHSYGAFMTANLLAHCDLFAAGIARSGAYNRTLTPFGFQAEQRTLWEAPEVYHNMSPFMHADRIREPILLIHGQADNNSGTYPLQSKRFYAALKGNGGTARLVMLPHESHGYRAHESVMHMAWEMTRWLDRFVRERPADL
jgi:dipeptidyl aminopeptidase/acylaminoacyl peptidase